MRPPPRPPAPVVMGSDIRGVVNSTGSIAQDAEERHWVLSLLATIAEEFAVSLHDAPRYHKKLIGLRCQYDLSTTWGQLGVIFQFT